VDPLNWRERLWEQNWIIPLLPNYMKPLEEPSLLNEHTKEFVYQAEEFISDLSALSELPRIDKTFKRSIQGFSYKIKIKQKKIHVEMVDTNKSSSNIKKRVYISTYRKNIKMENGFGKILDSTIYYHIEGKTVVRNVRRHSLFLSIFHHLHRLDLSLSGETFNQEPVKISSENEKEQQLKPTADHQDQVKALLSSAEHTYKQFRTIDQKVDQSLKDILTEIKRCNEEFQLLDLEEKHHMKRMIQHDLPNLLNTYDSLSENQKKYTYNEMVSSLKSMRSFLQLQANDLQETRMDRMNYLLKLNELRYDSNNDTKKM
jgi:glutaredoxin-related protein